MFRCGLLVLTSPIPQLLSRINPILNEAASLINETLFIHLEPEVLSQVHTTPPTESLSKLVTNIYTRVGGSKQCLDVRVLLHKFTTVPSTCVLPHAISNPVEVVLTDFQDIDTDFDRFLKKNFIMTTSPKIHQLSNSPNEDVTAADTEYAQNANNAISTYGHIVLGGTFDRLHNGHKILLSESCMRADEKITIGVTDGPMIRNKKLTELILPIEERCLNLRTFLSDVKPQVLHDHSLVPIVDPYGPSIVYADMTAIVVSEETRSGGHAVNKKRKEKGLSELDVHVINLVEDCHHAEHEEVKISSSSQRIRLLGTLLSPPLVRPDVPSKPYIIGLSGGSASGKSTICRRLGKLGAGIVGIVDCDKLGHTAYEPGKETFKEVVKEFGEDIVGEDGFINRKALGAKVFSDKANLEKLNQIVWPAIAQMAKEEIEKFSELGVEVCILDAAVLLEAGWDKMVHEIWVSIVPEAEAVKRIVERDNLPAERAKQRINSQLSNQQRVNVANVVFSTLWEPEVTQKQVEKAWSGLLERIITHDALPKL